MMSRNTLLIIIALFFLGKNQSVAQGTLPIYSDYLSDNIFFLHPSAVGIGFDGKLRIAHRQQWAKSADHPSLQTIGYHDKLGRLNGYGATFFKDKNGYHSQMGGLGVYAYRLNFSNSNRPNMVTFALAAKYIQTKLDQTEFVIPDPLVSNTVESSSVFNVDFSTAYHKNTGYIYLTAKNLIKRDILSDQENALNSRRIIMNTGYFFGRGEVKQFEPSMKMLYIPGTKEFSLDLNAKYYLVTGFNQRIWMGFSYRKGFEKNEYQGLNQITPLLGVEIDRYLISYAFTQNFGKYNYETGGGFHHISLGLNIQNKRTKKKWFFRKNIRNRYRSNN